MRKICGFVLAMIALTATVAGAQNLLQGDMVVAASTADLFRLEYREEAPGGNFADGNTVSSSGFYSSLNGYLGYFVTNGFEVGPDVLFEHRRTRTGDLLDTWTNLTLGLQVGYFRPTTSNLVPYARLGTAFVSSTFSGAGAGGDGGESGFSLTPRAGVLYFLADQIAINLNSYLKYSRVAEVAPATDEPEARQFDIGAELGLLLKL